MIYFLVYPRGDRTRITVIDLSQYVSYERGDWDNVNSDTFYSPEEAIVAGRDIAQRHNLSYELFESRYDSSSSEQLR